MRRSSSASPRAPGSTRSARSATSRRPPAGLGSLLEELYARYDARRLPFDPLRFPRRYADPADREVAGIVAAVLAYGNARAIGGAVERALLPLGSRPASHVRGATPNELRRAFRGFCHRWTRGDDVAALLGRIGVALERHGSLRALFLLGYRPTEPDVGRSLTRFVDALLDGEAGSRPPPAPGPGLRYLLPRPADGSACKRLAMFLRWMVRRDDGLDLGLWPEVSPSHLVVPLDTHTGRVARGLGLTRRATTDWRAACEVTRSLRRYDPDDPVRFDFALCHVSMSGDWSRHVRLAGARRGSVARLP